MLCYGVLVVSCFAVLVVWCFAALLVGVLVFWWFAVLVVWCFVVLVSWCFAVLVVVATRSSRLWFCRARVASLYVSRVWVVVLFSSFIMLRFSESRVPSLLNDLVAQRVVFICFRCAGCAHIMILIIMFSLKSMWWFLSALFVHVFLFILKWVLGCRCIVVGCWSFVLFRCFACC